MPNSRPNLIPILFLVFLFVTCCTKTEQSEQQKISVPEKQIDVKPSSSGQIILFFGNSLTAGYGVEPEQAFPYLIQQRIDSMGHSFKVVNAGLSGETTASGVNRIEWVLREPVAILVLELGGNDGLRGVDPTESGQNLQQIIDLTRNKYPDIRIIISGMEAPPNMGQEYITAFRSIYQELAHTNSLPIIPFLLEGVGGEPQLNLQDGIHPNEQGHKIVAENVWKVLGPELLDLNSKI